MKQDITFIGLGRMGLAMSTQLVEKGFSVHGYDPSPEARARAAGEGITVHDSIAEAVAAQPETKTVWLMVPAKNVTEVLAEVTMHVTTEDTIIDGGNSFFSDSIKRNQTLAEQGIHYLDCGTSGGVEGARYGASLMVGGDVAAVATQAHFFTALAAENGYGHVGGPGAGHFVKMVHNGIEYGMMGAIAEGLNVLHEHKDALSLDIMETLKPYNNGSIIDSSLMRWVGNAYHTEGYLEDIAGRVPVGETEVEMEYLVENQDVLILEAALRQRKKTRETPSFIGTLISAMRNQFGGHKTISNK